MALDKGTKGIERDLLLGDMAYFMYNPEAEPYNAIVIQHYTDAQKTVLRLPQPVVFSQPLC